MSYEIEDKQIKCLDYNLAEVEVALVNDDGKYFQVRFTAEVNQTTDQVGDAIYELVAGAEVTHSEETAEGGFDATDISRQDSASINDSIDTIAEECDILASFYDEYPLY